MAGMSSSAPASPAATWHRQSFRTMARELERGSTALPLAASGDQERLGSTMKNFDRFKGPGPPEAVLIPYHETAEYSRRVAEQEQRSKMPITAPLHLSNFMQPAPPRRVMHAGASPEMRRARLALSVSSPLYGVEVPKMLHIEGIVEDERKRTLPLQDRLSRCNSAPHPLAKPAMSLLREDIPNRPGFIMPGWKDSTKQAKMTWQGMGVYT
eukprot:TRINITY_DN95593_c0_g1_i1.p1 TRINITY_DN95593_c0_g1~~TRINITY_DN95593_c0_g1_i1.p1  ORF type:complete len:211 (-),score=23.04 TRINITY_DN95593_c0_g1_i1:71-703(-)